MVRNRIPNWLGSHFGVGLALFAHDAAVLYLIMEIVHRFRLDNRVPEYSPALAGVMAAIIGSQVLGLYLGSLYHFDRRVKPYEIAARTFMAVAITGTLIASILYVTKLTDHYTVLWRGNLVVSLATFAFWSVAVRYILQAAAIEYGRELKWLVLGTGSREALLKADYMNEDTKDHLVFLPIDEDRLGALKLEYGQQRLRVTDSADTIFDDEVSGIVIASDSALPDSLVGELMGIRLKGVPIIESTDYYEQQLLRVPVLQLGEHWFAMSEGFKLVHGGLAIKTKRLIDVVVAAIGLIVAIPVMLVVAIALKLTSKGPVIYAQTRCGFRGERFTVYKFRTMIPDAERNGAQWSVPGDPRITPIGRWLRKTRLDELPQLWNVIRGDMSLVGPRPERPDFVVVLEKQIPYYDMRHLVKPGLTGWAQVKYPYGSSPEDARRKLDYDLYYVKHYSLYFDLYIVLRTMRVVISRAGV
ncbi:MAG: sugar transferase [Proteobacteria bacterium]|nr:MAG: sugar transferase [Pseudomonadota bacterium]